MRRTLCRHGCGCWKEDNRALSARAEDFSLLGLISEGGAEWETRAAALDHLLERSCILKDLPLAGVALRCDGVLVWDRCFSLDSDVAPAPGQSLPLTGARSFPEGFQAWDWNAPGADWPGCEATFRPRAALVLPFVTRDAPEAVLVLASDRHPLAELLQLAPLLQRVVQVTATQLDLHSALAQMQRLNAELDSRVAERTVEVEEANRSLRREIEARRQEERRAELPLLLCSGFAGEVGAAALATVSPGAFLAKPYTRKKLSRVLEKLVDRGPS